MTVAVATIVRFVTVTTTGNCEPGIDPLAPDPKVAERVLVAFQPDVNLGPVKMPPVDNGKPVRIVRVITRKVVFVKRTVEFNVVVGEVGTGESVMVVVPSVALSVGV